MRKYLTLENIGVSAGFLGVISILHLLTKDEYVVNGVVLLTISALVFGYCKGRIDSQRISRKK